MFILRVDDRLIHGQVIAGWVRPLGIELIILASNEISCDEWSANAYRLAVPEKIAFSCVDLQNCIRSINENSKKRIMTIVESMREAFDLVMKGLQIKEVNVGGLRYKDGAREIAPYIYLSPKDIKSAVKIYKLGVKVIGRQLPNSPPIDVMKCLAGII